MEYVFAPIVWLLGFFADIVLWLVWQLLWIVLWLVLPILVVAFIALRAAEYVLGQARVRAWVRARTAKFGSAASIRARRLLFALGVVPVRVLFWFVIYAVWHSIVSLYGGRDGRRGGAPGRSVGVPLRKTERVTQPAS